MRGTGRLSSEARFFVARDHVDADADDIRPMLAFGRVKVLPINGNRTAGTGIDRIIHLFHLGASQTVFGSPVNAVTDQTVAPARETTLAVDTKGDAKLVLTQTHY